jgi:hypothetical protein
MRQVLCDQHVTDVLAVDAPSSWKLNDLRRLRPALGRSDHGPDTIGSLALRIVEQVGIAMRC